MKNYTNLRCPFCRGILAVGEDLHCSTCNITYPIKNGIPIMLTDLKGIDHEQNLAIEKEFYEQMFSGLKGLDDGHCIVYGYDQIYKLMEQVERGSMLEAGCGAGHHSVNLTKMGFKVTSVDLSLNGLSAAKQLAIHEGCDVSFICGDIKKLPFTDNEFDICFCSLILHHFTALTNVIKELCRVTKKYFIAYEVNALDPVSYLRFNILNPAIGIKNISKNQRSLFPRELEMLLRHNGFTSVKLQYEDVHEYIGKTPKSKKAKMIRIYRSIMSRFPERYSSNKFLICAKR